MSSTNARLHQIDFALRDIQATLAMWPDRPPSQPYCAKLWREFDNLLDEKRRLTSRSRARRFRLAA